MEDYSPPSLEICDYCADYFPILEPDKDWKQSRIFGNYMIFDEKFGFVCFYCREKYTLIYTV